MIGRAHAVLKRWMKAFRDSASLRVEQRDMTELDEADLIEKLDFGDMACANNIKLMAEFTARSREEFSRKTKSMILYLPNEAHLIKKLEEEAALRAAPIGYDLKALNGINIGCGDRRVSPYLTLIDIMREPQSGGASGEHHAFLDGAFLANPESLPFKQESLDYIVALHMLEHVANPHEVLTYWATLLKPGGGIGIILPNYEYTWDAHGDHSHYGHKWNSSVDVFRRIFDIYLDGVLNIETIGTLPHKISFDVVLRKPGAFCPFHISDATSAMSGAELAQRGLMISQNLDC